MRDGAVEALKFAIHIYIYICKFNHIFLKPALKSV